jgi:cyclohexa-1,5-dienecarbonyl-CoA hydratase
VTQPLKGEGAGDDESSVKSHESRKKEANSMAFKHIQTELKDGVAYLTLNRAPLNWLNIEMMREIGDCLDGWTREKVVKFLVVQAVGKAFSVGAEVADHLGDLGPKMIEAFHRMFRLMDRLGVPSLAVVNGSALGGGCELALYCDMVIATEKAKFGQPEIQVGVFPPIAALILPRIIGRKKAMELILAGDTISAQEALGLGLINKVVPEASLAQEVEAFIGKFTKLSGIILKLTKEAALAGLNDDLDQGLRTIEKIYLEKVMKTHDAMEGLTAFLEKRKPTWKNE